MLLSFVKAKMMKGLDKMHIDVATAEGGEIGDSLLESHSRRQKTVTIAKKKVKTWTYLGDQYYISLKVNSAHSIFRG